VTILMCTTIDGFLNTIESVLSQYFVMEQGEDFGGGCTLTTARRGRGSECAFLDTRIDRQSAFARRSAG
jgi:hypothetical protein